MNASSLIGQTVYFDSASPFKLATTPATAGFADAGNGSGKHRFEMLAYTGGIATPAPGMTVVIDLPKMDTGSPVKPILRNHDQNRIVGYSDAIDKTDQLVIRGYVTESTEAGREVLALADEGFPWQASVGIYIQEITTIEDGKKALVNNQTCAGPLIVVTKSVLKESSFCPLGADGQTTAKVIRAAQMSMSSDADPVRRALVLAQAQWESNPAIRQGRSKATYALDVAEQIERRIARCKPTLDAFALDPLTLEPDAVALESRSRHEWESNHNNCRHVYGDADHYVRVTLAAAKTAAASIE